MITGFDEYVAKCAQAQGVTCKWRDPFTGITDQNKPVHVNMDKFLRYRAHQVLDPFDLSGPCPSLGYCN